MPHSFAPPGPALLDDFMFEVQAMSDLEARLARYTKLWAKHGVSSTEFVERLDTDELAFFLSCPPRLVYWEVRRWLGYLDTRPTTTPDDREKRVRHGWQRLYERARATDPTARHTIALRLRTVFTIREGVLHAEPFDVPWALEEDFLDWLYPEAIALSDTFGWELFRGAVRAWLAEYFWRVKVPRLSGRPVDPMQPRECQASFLESEHFDLHLRRVAEQEGVKWDVEVPPAPSLGITVVSGQTA